METAEMERMLAVDDRHWWFAGRRDIVAAVLPRNAKRLRILDAGCGSGRTMKMLASYGDVQGIDIDPAALDVARRAGLDVQYSVIEHLPFADDSFDLVTSLDVLEHTDDDSVALREIARVLAPGGWLVATVPAFQVLWSSHDVSHMHRRRYRTARLVSAAEAAGLQTVRTTYFNSTLFPIAAAMRLLDRARGARPNGGYLEVGPPSVNTPLTRILQAEGRLIRSGRQLPFGLSLLGVFAKSTPA